MAGDSVMIHFPRKSFYFNHPRNPGVGSRSQKVKSLKDFEVCSVQEKEPEINEWTYQAERHGHLLKALEEVLMHCLIGLSLSVPDRHWLVLSPRSGVSMR
jgi:hypothetical protein